MNVIAVPVKMVARATMDRTYTRVRVYLAGRDKTVKLVSRKAEFFFVLKKLFWHYLFGGWGYLAQLIHYSRDTIQRSVLIGST